MSQVLKDRIFNSVNTSSQSATIEDITSTEAAGPDSGSGDSKWHSPLRSNWQLGIIFDVETQLCAMLLDYLAYN